MKKIIIEAYMEVADEFADILKESIGHEIDKTNGLSNDSILKLRIDKVFDVTEVVGDAES